MSLRSSPVDSPRPKVTFSRGTRDTGIDSNPEPSRRRGFRPPTHPDTYVPTEPASSKWYGPLVFACACGILLAQYIPYFTFYGLHTVNRPVLRSDSHYGDVLYLLIVFLAGCAQCFGTAQPFLLLVMIVNVIAVDVPWQMTLTFSSLREVSCPTGDCPSATPQPLAGSKLDLSLGLIRLAIDTALIVGTSLELRRTKGRLFAHVEGSAVKAPTAVLFFLCGFSAFLNQLPTIVAVFLTQYFYVSCDENDISLLEAERRFPLMSYFFSIFLLLISGVTSRVQSKVLVLLAIITSCTIAFLGQVTAVADASILAHKDVPGGCQAGYHVLAAVVYAMVLAFIFAISALLWLQYTWLKEDEEHHQDNS